MSRLVAILSPLSVSLILLLSAACDESAPTEPEPAPAQPPEPKIDRETMLRQAAARVEAEREKHRDEMRALGSATVTRKKITGSDKNKKAELEFTFKNEGDKELTQVRGTIVFRDSEGNPLKKMSVPFDQSIPPGKSAEKRGKFPLDVVEEGDVTFAKTPLSEMKIEWIPQLYRLADGTELVGE